MGIGADLPGLLRADPTTMHSWIIGVGTPRPAAPPVAGCDQVLDGAASDADLAVAIAAGRVHAAERMRRPAEEPMTLDRAITEVQRRSPPLRTPRSA